MVGEVKSILELVVISELKGVELVKATILPSPLSEIATNSTLETS